ncbi:MAG: Putative ABC-type transport system, periplasmic component/surface lipoprotein [Petrotoga mobilis]|nr:MAG: Putative ABC-type transport system, periplasmic component/surface lipoprotein [Petrotoga mobilis]
MKKVLATLLVGILAVFSFAAGGEDVLKVALLINAYLGDMSFFDSANNGMELIKKEFGAITHVIETGNDMTKWQPALEDLSMGEWDVIVVLSPAMVEILEEVAPRYPDKKYILCDASVNYESGKYSNVYSMQYKQNEASFLGGVLAALVTNSDLPLANSSNIIGFLGGTDTPVINDFLVGYVEGAQYIDPNIKVAISYVGNFYDAAKGKELTLSQFNLGSDIVFNVAGGAGLGALEAAKEAKRYAMGVDADQAMLFKDSDPEKANLILTSVLKRVDMSLYRAIDLLLKGELKWGEAEALGLKEGAVGLAKNEFYEKLVPEDIKNKIENIEKEIIEGNIEVKSALTMDTHEINQMRNKVKP